MTITWPWRRKPAVLDLTPYQGQWVAVQKGRIIDTAQSAPEMLEKLRARDHRVVGVKVEYEPRPEEVQRWAVVYGDRMRPAPNCWFLDRDAAESWLRSFPATFDGIPGRLVHRENHRDPWREVAGYVPE